MIVAAIDNSGSTREHLYSYRNEIFQVLSTLKCPIQIILWSHYIESNHILPAVTNLTDIFGIHDPRNGTRPETFLQILPTDKSIQLYVFTDGQLENSSIEICYNLIKSRQILISRVNLYYIGNIESMEMQFTTVFRDIPQEIYIQGNQIAQVKAEPIDFSNVDYKVIMEDESFKVKILHLLNNPEVDPTHLKKRVCNVMNNILKKHFEDDQKLSIREFYEKRDIQGCCTYIKDHAFQKNKSAFQKKQSDILKLFDKKTDLYSVTNFCDVSPHVVPEKIEPLYELQEKDLEYLTCDILYDVCDIACIPVKTCSNPFWPDKKIIQNPFILLESEEFVQRIVSQVEHFILDYKKTYQNLQNPNISPFSRDSLKGVYVLYHPKLEVKPLIRHNNFILSTFFQNKLPGKPVLWHLVFLYILGTRKFPEYKEIFFRNIRLLSESETYFVSLTPYLNPPVVDTLNICFWYIACICPVVWANNKKNVLRKPDFVSGVFLDFYRDVFDPSYEHPKEMRLWQLWHKFCSDHSKTIIFLVLSRYFKHERLISNNKQLISDKNFEIILYREKVELPDVSLDLETVLNLYHKYKQSLSPNFYDDLSQIPPANIKLFNKDEEEENKLKHVHINIKTCQPYIYCIANGLHWRDCIGEYNVIKQSYLRLFRRYCIQYEQYPENANDLMIYLNKYIFERNDKIPEIYHPTLPQKMNQVMQIFKEVMKTYPCKEYLNICKKCSSEKDRLKFEID